MAILISAQTAAKSSGYFSVQAGESITISASNLQGAEQAIIYLKSDTVDLPLVNPDGSAVKLTATIPMLCLSSAGTYKIDKPVTAGSCSISLGV